MASDGDGLGDRVAEYTKVEVDLISLSTGYVTTDLTNILLLASDDDKCTSNL